MTRPTVSPPQRSFSQASSGSISVEPLTVPPTDRTHSPLVPSPRANSTTSSEYSSTVQPHPLNNPAITITSVPHHPLPRQEISVFTYSSQESNHLLAGEEPLPSPTLATLMAQAQAEQVLYQSFQSPMNPHMVRDGGDCNGWIVEGVWLHSAAVLRAGGGVSSWWWD